MNFQESCDTCSKESYKIVPVVRIFEKLEDYFSRNDIASARETLEYWLRESHIIGDERGRLIVLSELCGLYRRSGERDKGLSACRDAIELIESGKFGENRSVAVIYINAATTMKAFGEAEKSLTYYRRAMEIFDKNGIPTDYERAALSNNMASAYRDLCMFAEAEAEYNRALDMLIELGTNPAEVAVTFVNLAHLYYDINPEDSRIEQALEAAWTILDSPEVPRDGNYAFVASKCAPSYGFFGWFMREKQLKREAERIYAGN